MKLKKKQRIILVFIIGYVMMAAGLLMFTYLGVADIGVYAWSIGGVHIVKILIVLPMLIGILRIFQDFYSPDAKIIMAIGALLIVLPAVQSIRYRFQPISVLNYMIILVLMFGGMAIILWSIHMRNKDGHLFDKK